ncbi:MAG: Sec-independent protein translocase protein TatB [Anaerolineales bacterium]|jgi:Tat protein translocase TatB subunit
MDFLGIGPLELLVVLIIALIVVGPERLPEIARSIGKTLRDLRAMSQGFSAEWEKELNRVSQIETGNKEIKKSVTEPLKEAQSDLQRALTGPLTSPSDGTAEPAPPKTQLSKPNTSEEDAGDGHS